MPSLSLGEARVRLQESAPELDMVVTVAYFRCKDCTMAGMNASRFNE